MNPVACVAAPGALLTAAQIEQVVTQAVQGLDFRQRRLLLIVPDSTRTAPLGALFRSLFDHLGYDAAAFDVLVALGTHQPMTEAQITERLDLTPTERHQAYGSVRFFNHAWDDPQALTTVGTLPADEIRELSGGRFASDVVVEVNRRLFDYDQILILGPVFPHEVVGFSGGNKYLFPGVAGPRILNFFHWLGAVITTPKIIGHADTPVRRVVDRAAALVPLPKACLSFVVEGTGLRGLFSGTPETAWRQAAALSAQCHIVDHAHPYSTILACAPGMYDEIWTAGKCMYKLEAVLADGGELIIHAPHIKEFSVTHGTWIERVGYHCRDFFLHQWDRYQSVPWGVLAHATHVYGLGRYVDGRETPRARVTLATRISPERCAAVNLGYRDPDSIRPADYAGRESEGVLLVPKAGEVLHRLKTPPPWAA